MAELDYFWIAFVMHIFGQMTTVDIKKEDVSEGQYRETLMF